MEDENGLRHTETTEQDTGESGPRFTRDKGILLTKPYNTQDKIFRGVGRRKERRFPVGMVEENSCLQKRKTENFSHRPNSGLLFSGVIGLEFLILPSTTIPVPNPQNLSVVVSQ